jgi:hypothetical protein
MIDPNVREFHASLGQELQSIKDRVRNLIGDSNWGDEGRYKEAILKDVLKEHLPEQYAIGTGFALGQKPQRTTQIDVLIYDKAYPLLFRQGDFIILSADGVRAIIEVKTKIEGHQLSTVIEKASENGEVIMSSHNDRTFPLFNGVFCFESPIAENLTAVEKVKEGFDRYVASSHDPNFRQDEQERAAVNHVVLDSHGFIKLFDAGRPGVRYSGYRLPELAAAYFVSNLMEFLQPKVSRNAIRWMYPLDSKEVNLLGAIPLRQMGS